MTDAIDRSTAALADRYRLERKLGQGGDAPKLYLRVIPDWVTMMVRAVDEAN